MLKKTIQVAMFAAGVLAGQALHRSLAQEPAAVGVAYDGLAEVNAKRAARGLPPYLRDEGLTQGAARLAMARARIGQFGHFMGGAGDFAYLTGPAAATGCAAYDPSYGWMSCGVYDGYRYAGAAWVLGRDGRRYMHLVVR